MENLAHNKFEYRFSARLSKTLFAHIKSKANPSDYVRLLIEKDIQVASNEQA